MKNHTDFHLSNDSKHISLDDKYALDTTSAYMTGVEALVRLPILQHQRDLQRGLNTAGFISGYRGSPLGGVDQSIWQAQRYLKKHNIEFLPAINEDMAASAVWGSQQVRLFDDALYDGVFGLWYGKGPGVDRSMDVIKHANAFGTAKYGGVLAVAGDDHGCKSSTLPHQSEHMFIGASMPVLNPANVQEVLDLGIYGWELSRYSGCWVALKAITDNMDSAISAEIDPRRIDIVIPDRFRLPDDGVNARWPDSPLDQERRLNKFKIYAAREFARVNHLNRIVLESNRARLGIITTGKAYLDVMQALEDLGIDEAKACNIGLRILKVGMSWPLEPVSTHEFASGLEEILVVEEKRSIIEDQLTGQLYNWPVEKRPRVVGEYDEQGEELLSNLGELNPALVAQALASRIKRFYQCESINQRLAFLTQKEQSIARAKTRINRLPHYCSGCPHNRSTLLPEGSRALAGIGCHYMAQWMMPERSAQTYSQMGGEGVSWAGQAPFTKTTHVFQNLGDGTYFHSGILAIRQAVASGINITYKILYNDAVAMTGGQSVDGSFSVEKLVLQLRAEGVLRIAVLSENMKNYDREFPRFKGLTVGDRDDLIPIEKELRDITGTTVIIFEQTCAAEKRRRRKQGILSEPLRRVIINQAVCEGCGDCGLQSNCLSIEPVGTLLGIKRRINQGSCNKDYSCVKGFCPSFVSVIGGRLKKSQAVNLIDGFSDLKDPLLPSLERSWNIVAAGVGGTGVLTVTSLVAMAAHIEGKGCATLNQTGLAQKFGSVISHVRVARQQADIRTVRIPSGDADLLLGCDLVVSASGDALSKVNQDRSSAIINTHQSPTSHFILDPDSRLPVDELFDVIVEEVGVEKTLSLNASKLTEQLLGDAIGSNVLLLGYAYQKGLVPVSHQSILQAIELNDISVEYNQQAFLWGRRLSDQFEQVMSMLPDNNIDKHEIDSPEELTALITDRYQRLAQYQNVNYANTYRQFIDKIREKETIFNGDKLSYVVAINLYRLMAYKDEYEVARLHSNDEFNASIRDQFDGDYQLRFHLAVPLISRRDKETGRLIKRSYPGWFRYFFSVLEKLKFLRGSIFDIFSYTKERRLERSVLKDYRNLVEYLQSIVNDDNYSLVLEIAGLASLIRGYGPVKIQSIERYYEQKKILLKKIEGQYIEVVELKAPSKKVA